MKKVYRDVLIVDAKKALQDVLDANADGGALANAIGDINLTTLKVAGRVVGIIDAEHFLGAEQKKAILLEDNSGRIEILIAEEKFDHLIGAILSVKVELKENELFLRSYEVLVKCEDFYINSASPNYLKVVIDQNLKEKLVLRSKIIAEIRRFFDSRAFLEFDTPSLVKFPGQEPYLDVFKTKFKADYEGQSLQEDLYLITSPEYALKKYLVGGFEKIYQITKSFRNKESFSNRHNPEFTILEWYRAYADYSEIMDDTEELIKYLWKEFRSNQQVLHFNNCEVDMIGKWQRLKVVEAFEQYAGISQTELEDLELLRKKVLEKNYQLTGEETFDDLFFTIFMNEIEPFLGKDVPVILYDYPISMAALSKPCSDDSKYAERFEVYIAGLEICNAFSELNDWQEQKKRLENEKNERLKMGKDAYDVDLKFIEALKFGMPPSGGNALGVDRLVMLLTNEENIENVIYLPYKDL